MKCGGAIFLFFSPQSLHESSFGERHIAPNTMIDETTVQLAA